MKFIFLDFDGVLNSDDYMLSIEYLKEIAGMSDAEIMLIAHHLHLDPKPIKLVNELVDKTGAKVVASTTWRKKYSLKELDELCQSRGATFSFYDRTPDVLPKKMSMYVTRGDEIAEYLKSLPEKPESFVILDDNGYMGHLLGRLVQTTLKHGLTKELADKALKILNGE